MALNLPLTSPAWEVRHGQLPDGRPACAITSGDKGLTVTLIHPAGGQERASVRSNHPLGAGARLTLTFDSGGSFETYENFFPPKDAPALVEKFAGGGKAYLEWSEFSGEPGRGRMNVQNILRLDDFAEDLKQCRKALEKQ